MYVILGNKKEEEHLHLFFFFLFLTSRNSVRLQMNQYGNALESICDRGNVHEPYDLLVDAA
jgi:DNA-binding transcriptional regulator of glucitol operon